MLYYNDLLSVNSLLYKDMSMNKIATKYAADWLHKRQLKSPLKKYFFVQVAVTTLLI